MTLGVGKKGFQRIVEFSLFVGLAAWIVVVFLYASGGEAELFPAPFDAQLVDSAPVKWVGVASITAGLVIFVLLWSRLVIHGA
jgi:hypothetical protein